MTTNTPVPNADAKELAEAFMEEHTFRLLTDEGVDEHCLDGDPEILTRILAAKITKLIADVDARADTYEVSLHALLSAFPLDPGDWPIEDGEAAAKSLLKWIRSGEPVESWGDDVSPDTFVGAIASLRAGLRAAEKLAKATDNLLWECCNPDICTTESHADARQAISTFNATARTSDA